MISHKRTFDLCICFCNQLLSSSPNWNTFQGTPDNSPFDLLKILDIYLIFPWSVVQLTEQRIDVSTYFNAL